MAGRQRSQWREERSKPVHTLLGICPSALSLCSPPPFPFCCRAAATAGGLCQSRDVPLPLRHSAITSKNIFAGLFFGFFFWHKQRSEQRSCVQPRWLPSLPNLSLSSLGAMGDSSLGSMAPAPLLEIFPGQKVQKKVSTSLWVLGKISPCIPECQNTAHVETQLPPRLHRHKGWFSAFPACWSPLTGVRLPHDHLQGERLQREWKEKNLGN